MSRPVGGFCWKAGDESLQRFGGWLMSALIGTSELHEFEQRCTVSPFTTNPLCSSLKRLASGCQFPTGLLGAHPRPLAAREFPVEPSPSVLPIACRWCRSAALENGVFIQQMHALDITMGNEKLGGPVAIHATVPGADTAPSDKIAHNIGASHGSSG